LNELKRLLFHQVMGFVAISGVGWIIDFSVYTILTLVGVSAGIANFLSALPAITFVFFLATKKTFRRNMGGVSLVWKYVLYVLYQLVLLTGVSYLNQTLFDLLHGTLAEGTLLYQYCALLTKVMITPITVFCNFIVLKRLAERI
jgi:putative flippase GtrA